MKRRMFLAALVGFCLLGADWPEVRMERTDCERKMVNRRGKEIEYQWLGYFGYITLAPNTKYTCYLYAEADGMGDGPLGDGVLPLMNKGIQPTDEDGVFQIRAFASTDDTLPWAVNHYHWRYTMYDPQGMLVFDTGIRYKAVSYP